MLVLGQRKAGLRAEESWFKDRGMLVSPPTAENFEKQTEHKKLHR